MDDRRPPVHHPYFLTFSDPEVEEAYRRDHLDRKTSWTSFSFASGLILYLLFILVDRAMFPGVFATFLSIRLLVGLPLIIIAYLLTRFPFYYRIVPMVDILALGAVGGSFVLMFLAGRDQPGIDRMMIHFSLVLMYAYLFLRMPLVVAHVFGLAYTSLYLILLTTFLNPPAPDLWYQGAYLVSINLICVIVAWLIERGARREFALRQALAGLISRDQLTDLRNRYFFQDTLVPDLERLIREKRLIGDNDRRSWQPGRIFGLFFADLDFFKLVNDRFGHAAGDRVLQEVAHLLIDMVRDSDVVLRWGGEEFLVILKDTREEYLDTFAGKMCEAIRRLVFDMPGEPEFHVSATVGYLSVPFGDISDIDRLVEIADQALYKGKREGRDCAYRALPDPDGIRLKRVVGNFTDEATQS